MITYIVGLKIVEKITIKKNAKIETVKKKEKLHKKRMKDMEGGVFFDN